MKSDFSRISFDNAHQFTAVLHQQGRVLTDSDFNEQSAIHAHMYESLAASLTGTEGAIYLEPTPFTPVPLRNIPGFRIVLTRDFSEGREAVTFQPAELEGDAIKRRAVAAAGRLDVFKDFNCWISPGHYYAGGLRCENEAWVPLARQPFLPPDTEKLPDKPAGATDGEVLLFYLDAWERPLSWLDEPGISDSALGRTVDTAMRSRLIWQVRTQSGSFVPATDDDKKKRLERTQALEGAQSLRRPLSSEELFASQPWVSELPWFRGRPRLRVRIDPARASCDPCRPSLDSTWQGVENQLYRVEIHTPGGPAKPAGGPAAPGAESGTRDKAYQQGADTASKKEEPAVPTFKWSRENGSVAARIESAEGKSVRIFPGLLKAGGFKTGDWLEALTQDLELTSQPGAMVRVVKVAGDLLTLAPAEGVKELPALKRGDKLRRWDQQSCDTGVIKVTDDWIDLEGGIQVCFEPAEDPVAAPVKDTDVIIGKDYAQGAAKAKPWKETVFRTGDYWVFTARTALADVEWPDERQPEVTIPAELSAFYGYMPRDPGDPMPDLPLFESPVPVRATGQPPALLSPRKPAALPPHGERHRYALLAMCFGQKGAWIHNADARRALRLCDPRQKTQGVQPATPAPPAGDNPQPVEGVKANPGLRLVKNVIQDTGSMKAVAVALEKTVPIEKTRAVETSKALESLNKNIRTGAVKATPGKAVEESAAKPKASKKSTPGN